MRQLLREPLLHFLVLGAALFAVFAVVGNRPASEPGRIVVTPERIEHLAIGFSRSWNRAPTAEELNGLVRDYIREEVYYREAKALGLDRDDTVIRRRLRQKLEFVSDDIAALSDPSDGDLAAFLAAHPEKFRLERRMSFSHVYLDASRRGETVARDAADLLVALNAEGSEIDPAKVGDRFLLDSRYDAVPASEISKLFGDSFAARLAEIAPAKWQGPFASGYGVHLVLLHERAEGRVPSLEEARETVRREWTEARRKQANDEFFAKLLGRYQVTVEFPGTNGAEPKRAAVLPQ
jgi:hypothetical protein